MPPPDATSEKNVAFGVFLFFLTNMMLQYTCVAGGNQDCVQLLVGAGANIELEDVKGQTPLFVATSQKKPGIMKV